MPQNLIEDFEGLIGDFDKVLGNQKSLALKAQEKFAAAKAHMSNTLIALREINDNIISLVDIDVSGVDIDKTASLLDAAPPGEIKGEMLTAIAEESSLALNMLYRGRIDITSIYKFSNNKVLAAKELGQQFRKYEKYWAQLRYRLIERKQPLLVVVPRGERMQGDKQGIQPKLEPKMFCEQLIKHEVFESAVPQLTKLPIERSLSEIVEDDGIWKEYDRNWLGYTNQNFLYNGPTRVLLKGQPTKEWIDFVMGSWFEAFVEHLFKDQLRRLRKPYEVFTQVKYTTDLVGDGVFKGELDVLVSTEDKIVIVECKSGRLRKAESDRILQRKSVISEALKIAHAQDMQVDFILVHAPRDPESQEIIDELAANGVQAFEPQGVIGFIREHF